MAVHFAFLTDTHHYPNAPKDYAAPKMLTRSQEVLDAIAPPINALRQAQRAQMPYWMSVIAHMEPKRCRHKRATAVSA